MPAVISGSSAATITQNLADVSNAIAALNKYANTVTSFTMPSSGALSRVDNTTYSDLIAKFGEVNQNAYVWLDGVGPQLQAIPAIYESTTDVLNIFLNNALVAAQALEQDPSDQNAQNALQGALQKATGTLNANLTSVQGFQTQTNSFATSLASALSDFQSVMTDVTTLYSDLQSDITKLQGDIDSLNTKISVLEFVIPASMIATGVTAVALAVRIPALMNWNPLVGGILIITSFIGTMIGELEEAALQDDITAAVALIQTDTSNMTDDGKAITAIGSAQTQLQSMQTEASSLNGSNGAVSVLQQTLSTLIADVQQVAADVKAAAGTQQMPTVIQDIQTAQSDWSTAVAVAQSFATNLSFNNVSNTLYVMHDNQLTPIPA
uniref:hypothetical protein n=1 Tax=Azospirillum argentinense TaxID=2970906 RepID=UPI0010C07338|nr:hypothetical protein [Azospirillum argentinense]